MTDGAPRPPISSRHNPRVKAAAALRERRARGREGRFLIDGVREIERAIDGGLTIAEAFLDPTAVALEPARQALVERLRAAAVQLVEVTPELLRWIAFGDRSEGVVVVVDAPPLLGLADLDLPADPLVVVLEGVEKPGNVGAVVRSADGAGVSAVILADPVSDPWTPNTIRASLGTVFTLPLRLASAEEARAWLIGRGLRLVAARVDGSIDYDAVDLTGPTAIILGSEAAGLSRAWSGEGVIAVRLPMLGRADSLNVSATAAVLCYEARRQRRLSRPRRGRT